MKTKLLCTLSLFVTLCLQAQDLEKTKLDFTDIETTPTMTIPYQSVQVMDARFDRSNIGFLNKVTKANSSRLKSVQSVASFPDSLHIYLPQILQKLFTFQQSGNDTLVLLVKQFRMTDRLLNRINRQFEPELLLRLSLSAFSMKDQQLTKLFSVDDLLVKRLPSDQIPKEAVIDILRKEALLAILQSIFEKKSWQKSSNSFAFPVVQQGIQQRFNLPVFTDSILRIGVYRNFREFKQNAPSMTTVQFRMNKEEVASILSSDGKVIDPKTIWGFCDGTNRFVVFRNEFYPLHRSDNGFYFKSFIRRTELSGEPSFGDYAPQTGILSAALIKAVDSKTDSHVFSLNMDEENINLEEIFGKSTLRQMEKELLK